MIMTILQYAHLYLNFTIFTILSLLAKNTFKFKSQKNKFYTYYTMQKKPQFILCDPHQEKEIKNPATAEEEEDEYQNECATLFANVDKANKKQSNLVKATPDQQYLVVFPGINLNGKCSNLRCKGKNGSWYHLGFGTFNINTEVSKGKCRQCGSKIATKTVLTVGFTRAIVQFQGLIIGINQKQIPCNEKYEERKGKFNYFQGVQDAKINSYQYLNIVCKQI